MTYTSNPGIDTLLSDVLKLTKSNVSQDDFNEEMCRIAAAFNEMFHDARTGGSAIRPQFTPDEVERLRGLIADPPVRPHVTAEMVHSLHDATGEPLMMCKYALLVCDGQVHRAAMYLAGRTVVGGRQ